MLKLDDERGTRTADISTTGRHIPALDGVRGIAISLVLAEHLLWSNPNIGSDRFSHVIYSLHTCGWIGVDLFFVLSGFLITGILQDSLHDRHFLRNFYARRALRIFPLYYCFFFVTVGISCAQGHRWGWGLLRYLTYTETLTPLHFPFLTDSWWVGVYSFWSLAIEEQFYLFWPLLILLLRRRRSIAMAAVTLAVLSVATRVAVRHSSIFLHNQYAIYSWTPVRLDGLLSGSLLAILIRSRYRDTLFHYWRVVLSGGLLGFAITDICYPGLPLFDHPDIAVWVPVLADVTFGALIAGAVNSVGKLRRLLEFRGFRFFGRYSYGLYVYHMTLASFFTMPARIYVDRVTGSKGAGVIIGAMVTLLATVCVSWLSYRFMENPFLRLKDRYKHTSGKTLRDVVREGNEFESARPVGPHNRS